MTVLLVAQTLTRTNASLLEAFSELGVDASLVVPDAARTRAAAGDTVLARLDVEPSLDGVEPGLWDLYRLKRRGVRLLNPPSALLAAHDKLATALRLSSVGLPHPRTAHLDGDAAAPSLRFPVVVKPRFGSWGRDVFLCPHPDALARCLAGLRDRRWFVRQGVLVQELVPPQGYDLRLIVAGGAVVGAVQRVAAPGEWRTNIALGARRQPVTPPPEASALATAAASALAADLVGVDLLPDGHGGWVVLELNGAADFTSDYSLDGVDVFEAAAEALAATELPALAAPALA